MEFVCICCPMGCDLEVKVDGENITVSGNTCPRGRDYAIAEVTAPTRTVTTTVDVSGGEFRAPVKTAAPIPKGKIFDALAEIKAACVTAPVCIGDVIVAGVAGTDVDVVATRNVRAVK